VKVKLVGKAQPLEVAQATEKVVADASYNHHQHPSIFSTIIKTQDVPKQ